MIKKRTKSTFIQSLAYIVSTLCFKVTTRQEKETQKQHLFLHAMSTYVPTLSFIKKKKL